MTIFLINKKLQLSHGHTVYLVQCAWGVRPLTYLLLIVGCVGQHGRHMEHDLIVLVSGVQGVGACRVSWGGYNYMWNPHGFKYRSQSHLIGADLKPPFSGWFGFLVRTQIWKKYLDCITKVFGENLSHWRAILREQNSHKVFKRPHLT